MYEEKVYAWASHKSVFHSLNIKLVERSFVPLLVKDITISILSDSPEIERKNTMPFEDMIIINIL